MSIKTVNPYTGKEIQEYEEVSKDNVREMVSKMRLGQSTWGWNMDSRVDYFKNVLKPNLLKRREELGKLMSMEMGKPISQSLAEIDKCIKLVDYALESFREFLEPEFVKTEGKKTYVRFDPLGVIFIIMPWNFPLWQVMRAAVPAMFAGNAVVLKHASIVTGTGMMIEEIFENEMFRSIPVSGWKAQELIKYFDGVSFTGSTQAGISIAEEASKNLKKTVLELGGSDPFIVLQSANVSEAAENALYARLQNNGQSCIASKRFIVHENVFDEFREKLAGHFSTVKIGDPLIKDTYLGPLSSSNQANTVKEQISDLSKMGKVEIFGKVQDNIIPPTIAELSKSYQEEVFGPVAILMKFRENQEALRLANDVPFGLGSSIWGNSEEAELLAPKIQAGMVFINKMVASDPRVPFGGVKRSGIGRELSKYGLKEFTNIKTVWVDH
ncbi:aldehyde dehydrogenase family protein [Oxyplasma meridianum]|uniref:Aldehyde dehydrogenase family protein n=1 Tax=Oxyplasma meridianum TaxID=3073602 RepID=A0AAX4NE88_9ARCH